TLEITESMLVDDLDKTLKLLNGLRQRNVSISIDDFGTGYSSLSYLYNLPVQTLKIDRTFTRPMDSSPKHGKIVQAIIQLAHQLGFATVTEGVESAQHVGLLRRFNCDFGQGYWFSRPQPVPEASRWLALHAPINTATRHSED
ncbi:PAS domain S-box protein, partial [filamentous cyanobacterium CCP5]